MRFTHRHPTRKLVEYDALQRRLWIFGQRCHHGAGGAVVAGLACARVLAQRSEAASALALALTGGALMAHDWEDRSAWFRPGRGARR
jgi:hypothetical protein